MKLKEFFKSHEVTQKRTVEENKQLAKDYLSKFEVEKIHRIDPKTGEGEMVYNRVTKQFEPQYRYIYHG